MSVIARHRATIDRIVAVLSVEVLSTLAMGLTGLLIVNQLPKEQYAMYTFLVAASVLLVGITDLGLVYCAMPIVGRRTDDRAWVVAACRRIYQKRWILFALGAPGVSVYAIVTMLRHDWTHWWFLLALGVTAVSAWVQLSLQFTGEVLAITQSIRVLNRASVRLTLSRAALVVVAMLPFWGDLRLALLFVAVVIASALALATHRRHIRGFGPAAVLEPAQRRAIDRRIVEIVRPLVLPGVYYQLQGFVTVLLATLTGAAAVVADVGALGRLVMLLLIVDRVAGTLLMPRLARAESRGQFDRLTLVGIAVYGGLAVLATGSALLLPQLWVLVLGGQYASTQGVVWIAVLTGTLTFLSGFLFRALMTQGFSQGQTLSIVVAIGSQLAVLLTVGLESTASVLAVGLANAIGQTVFQLVQLARLRRRPIGLEPTAAIEREDLARGTAGRT